MAMDALWISICASVKFRSRAPIPASNPRGIFLGTQIIVAFQPEYLTKYDRVYNVQCFYMERHCALEKELLIDMPPAPMQTQQVPMPVCRYEVLDGSPTGPPVMFAKVGQMVYHKWTCDSQTEGQFCMVVHSCKVDDGNGDQVELIDSQGCAKDKFLLSNLDYVSDLMVGKEAHVYKYADRPNLFFDCKISLTVKEPGQEFCDIPNCPDPPRRKRSTVEEVKINSPQASSPEYIIPKEMAMPSVPAPHTFELLEDTLCMSDWGLTSIVLVNLLTLASSGVLFYLGARKSREISFE
ncbi:unnamed protein product [Bursaphelenchus xylophilus]|uniref:(pine wood nematode) hypothetical protein n=1 Tax=Bursaphelenchus xylophilus TaxID=6326 RepID=A0A1I7RZC2_BURXY|nr:unnamed protein product [Bursaphelenchus xylophilus]CAG9106620.1 unnamed protein product [Bursaphelenchus xylophilus]